MLPDDHWLGLPPGITSLRAPLRARRRSPPVARHIRSVSRSITTSRANAAPAGGASAHVSFSNGEKSDVFERPFHRSPHTHTRLIVDVPMRVCQYVQVRIFAAIWASEPDRWPGPAMPGSAIVHTEMGRNEAGEAIRGALRIWTTGSVRRDGENAPAAPERKGLRSYGRSPKTTNVCRDLFTESCVCASIRPSRRRGCRAGWRPVRGSVSE